MKNLDYSKINESTEKRILEFLNEAKNPVEIAGKEPQFGPIHDHKKRGPINGYDIGIKVSERIIKLRNNLEDSKFQKLNQLNSIDGFGQDKLNDLAYSFGDDFEITHKIAKELNKTGLSENLKRLQADQHNRLINKVSPKVITIDADLDPELAPFPGGVTLFIAKKDSEIFDELKKAFESSNESRLKELGKKLRDIAQTREISSVAKAVDQLIDTNTYFDIRYGGKTLAPNIGLINKIEIGSLSFSYNGGALDDEDFKIIEFCDPRNCDPSPEGFYDYFIIKRAPKLSDLEIEVLKAVPANQLELNIGSIAACPIATVIIVIIFLAATVAGKTCGAFRDRLAEVVFPPKRVNEIGKLASARELLNIRREVFREFGM